VSYGTIITVGRLGICLRQSQSVIECISMPSMLLSSKIFICLLAVYFTLSPFTSTFYFSTLYL